MNVVIARKGTLHECVSKTASRQQPAATGGGSCSAIKRLVCDPQTGPKRDIDISIPPIRQMLARDTASPSSAARRATSFAKKRRRGSAGEADNQKTDWQGRQNSVVHMHHSMTVPSQSPRPNAAGCPSSCHCWRPATGRQLRRRCLAAACFGQPAAELRRPTANNPILNLSLGDWPLPALHALRPTGLALYLSLAPSRTAYSPGTRKRSNFGQDGCIGTTSCGGLLSRSSHRLHHGLPFSLWSGLGMASRGQTCNSRTGYENEGKGMLCRRRGGRSRTRTVKERAVHVRNIRGKDRGRIKNWACNWLASTASGKTRAAAAAAGRC